MANFEKQVQEIFALGDIRLNGDRPWDMQVNDTRVYRRLLAESSLGMGESYMDGWWDCGQLDEFLNRLLAAGLQHHVWRDWRTALAILKARWLNLQTPRRSHVVMEQHFDLGNEVYTSMLGKTMQYTCGYWADARDLDAAQEAKLELICRKLGLEPGMRVVELGGGFGGLAHFIAERYGCSVDSYNISQEQVDYARQWCKHLPVTIHKKDYRDATGTFDRVVSVGLMEHVGLKNYAGFMQLSRRLLGNGGLFLLHTIGNNISVRQGDAWPDKYIFRHGMLPSIRQITAAAEKQFVVEDIHNFGADYDSTLLAWDRNFTAAWNELKTRSSQYTERFHRMWRYYLLSFAGAFRARHLQLWQFVLSPHGVPGGYRSPR